MDLCSLGSADREALAPLVSAHPYSDYRNHRAFPKRDQDRILLGQIQRAAEQDHVVGVKEGDRILGLATLSAMPWDSGIFGLPMARIGPLIVPAQGHPRAPLVHRLLDGLLEVARAEGVRHVSTRVDCADVDAIHALERSGFRLMECLVTHVIQPVRDPLPPAKRLFPVRAYRPEDRDALVAIAQQMFPQLQSRFSADPDLPPEGAVRFYVEWTKNICSGEMADHILVAEKRGRPIGFLACKGNTDVRNWTGIRIAGQSLSASHPEGTGSYIGLLNEIHAVGREAGYDFMEAEGPLHHPVVVRTWQRYGWFLARAKYAFHRGLG